MKIVDTIEFPFGRVPSLHKVVDAWRSIAEKSTRDIHREVALDLIAQVEAASLLGEIDADRLEADHADLVEQLMSIVVPLAHSKDWLVGGMTPFKMESIYATPGFRRLIENEARAVARGTIGGFESVDELEHAKIMDAFHVILQEFYDTDTGCNFASTYTSRDADGLDAYYRLHVDPAFVDIETSGPLPELTDDEIQQLVAEPLNRELWTRLLPPELFTFKGITVVTLLDVTEHEVQSRLKNDLLQRDALTTPSKIDGIERHVRSLLRIPDLRIGVIGLATGNFEDIERSQMFGRSLLIDGEGVPVCATRDRSTYARLFKTGEPVVVADLEAYSHCTGFEWRIRGQNLKGLLLAPLKDGERLTGVLEVATSVVGKLTAGSVRELMDVISLFSAAMVRSLDERHDRLQALIKKEFTSIHPSVEWKFRREAEKLDANIRKGKKPEPEDIVFQDVYPLYGLSDIRDSSVRRTQAIQVDLIEQLGLALSVIVEASGHRPLPALDELGFRLARYAQTIEAGLTSDAEVGALEFLRNDVEPLFEKLSAASPLVQAKVEEYKNAIHEKLGVLYDRRRQYEESVAAVNTTISSFLQRQQVEAQSMYPHYFEKFETDGVDFNAYIGDSIAEDQEFDALHLRNLRLWQLQTMCGIVWELDRNQQSLPVPLELAHLILVQDFPIAIRFSKDEKRFGVDGAYNARYMIVKKRIDKAHVKGTSERITQPGKIAIVYSQEKERREYRRYLEYLSAAGYIEGSVEELDVEELQGVSGMRVLRVQVSSAPPEMEVRARPDLAAQIVSKNGDVEVQRDDSVEEEAGE